MDDALGLMGSKPIGADMVKFIQLYARDLPRFGDIMAPQANSFGVLRLAMATLVLISHSYYFAFGTPEAEPLTAWTGHSLGEHAVQVFFILSGILVAQSFERSRSLLDFVAARVLRIFPALIVCVLMTALLLGPLVSHLSAVAYFTSPALPAYLLKTLSLSTGSAPLPGVFENVPLASNVNISLWTLKYEVLCYVGLACAGMAGLFNPRWRNSVAVALAMFLVVIFAAEPKHQSIYGFSDNIRYFSLFFGTGVLAFLMRDRIVIAGEFVAPLAVLAALVIGTRFGELATALFLGYAVVWLAAKSFGPLRGLCNRVDLSFGVYIFAGPIQQALIEAAPSLSPLLIAALASLIVFPLALLSWVLIERPALQLRSRLRLSRAKNQTVRRARIVHG
jgi:peptidoglycan/LPS O-acetylase OafA/YrhL